MSSPFAHVLRELEQEKARIDNERARVEEAIAVIQRLADGPNGQSPVSRKPLSEETTNEDAVDAVLARYDDLTTREIKEKAERLGKTLNMNSIRWTLHHAVEDGKYRKRKDGRVNRYSLAKKETA